LQSALLVEIAELRYAMVSCVSLFCSRLGLLDHDLIAWLEPIETEYQGPDKEPGALVSLQQVKAMPVAELAAANAAQREPASGMSLKQYS
jgi:hypothetical protein